jgi:hypothetical protein
LREVTPELESLLVPSAPLHGTMDNDSGSMRVTFDLRFIV